MPSKLTQDKVYKLHKWLEDWPLTAGDTYRSLGTVASKQLGFQITEANMSGALAAMEKKLPKPVPPAPPPSDEAPATKTELRTVATELMTLMQELGRPAPSTLTNIAKPQQALL